MVTFKLIQLYPGSKPLGYILNPVNNGLTKPDNYYQNGIWFNPKDYPEFWEEVVEKDYEILSVSLQRSDKHEIRDVSEYENTGYIESLISCHGNKIHSVKRLSDGEIFTIGDKVFSEYVNYTINKIGIVNDKCMVSALYDTNNPNGSRLHYNLKNLKKVKQPLFTTEDGVDIFEGDIYYSINTSCWLEFETKGSFSNLLHPLFKHFSTKENLKEYILMNKPLLSLSNVWDNLKVKDQKEVMKFVKSKLNK